MTTKNSKMIQRMARYKHAILRVKKLGFEKIYSDYLGELINATSAQVRKDFSIFSIKGSKRGGYNIDRLLIQLNRVLGNDEITKAILVGKGHLGSALINYGGFKKDNVEIVAAFDIDPSKISRSDKIPVFLLDDLDDFCEKNRDIKTAILTIPEQQAETIYDKLTGTGFRGILNFAPVHLKSTDECYVNNVNLCIEMDRVVYYANQLENK